MTRRSSTDAWMGMRQWPVLMETVLLARRLLKQLRLDIIRLLGGGGMLWHLTCRILMLLWGTSVCESRLLVCRKIESRT